MEKQASAPPCNETVAIFSEPLTSNIIPYEDVSEKISASLRDALSSNCCKHCGLFWSEHIDHWEFKKNMVVKNMKAIEILDSVKYKKRDQLQYDKKLKLLKADIDNLLATNDVYFKLTAKQKETEYKKIEDEKRQIDTFFEELDINQLEKDIDDFIQYQNAGTQFLKNQFLTFLTLEQIMNADLYVQYLDTLIHEYKRRCENLLRNEYSLKSQFNVFNSIENEAKYEKSKSEYENIMKKIRLLLCKISITKQYVKDIMTIHGDIRDHNEANYYSAGALLRQNMPTHTIEDRQNMYQRQLEDRQLYFENEQTQNVIATAFRLENNEEQTRKRTFFQYMLTGFGIFDTKAPVANLITDVNNETNSTTSSEESEIVGIW
jgi:hypothetical protein